MPRTWFQVTSGRGPAECCWVVAQVVAVFEDALQDAGLKTEQLELVPGDERGTLRSALVAVEGSDEALSAIANGWEGTIQWIGQSPFRPNHKRKNWFVGIERLEPPARVEWSSDELRVDVMRASGAGGQHVNKTESAVRITHEPTGLVAQAQEERSQRLNRQLALARLAQLFAEREESEEKATHKQRWTQHNHLERGNPTRVFTGKKFREKRLA